ncbi:MAG TPA: hypothetical protein VK593_09960, partial [Edaphobacter sp.]|nr:hypothetical protein [Edaphobacter sp.]
PSHVEGRGGARVMLFVSFDGSLLVTNSDYRKFKATSTILPGVATVKESPAQPDETAAPVQPK